MFKKFDERENISGITQTKSSVLKNIKVKLVEAYPHIESHVNDILPKKDPIKIVKCHDHIEILAGGTGDLLFFKHREVDFIPTLKLLHKYPFILPRIQVDKGAIKFILSGANIMCPGLTSAGARLGEDLPEGSVVSVFAEGKQHALGIGKMKMSSEKIRSVNKGIGVENIHFLSDGLWHMKPVK